MAGFVRGVAKILVSGALSLSAKGQRARRFSAILRETGVLVRKKKCKVSHHIQALSAFEREEGIAQCDFA